MIEQAIQIQKEKKLDNLTWKIGDILTLPFDDSSFSLLITRYILTNINSYYYLIIFTITNLVPNI